MNYEPNTPQPQSELGDKEPMRERLSLAHLKALFDKHRKLAGKPFIHTKTGENYQVLFTSFDESTNEVFVVYVLSAMTWLKFHRPVGEFLEKFEPRESK